MILCIHKANRRIFKKTDFSTKVYFNTEFICHNNLQILQPVIKFLLLRNYSLAVQQLYSLTHHVVSIRALAD